MKYSITVENTLGCEDNKKNFEIINDYNWEAASIKPDTLFISLKDAKNTLRGGLKGIGLCGSLYIQVLSIEPTLRRQNLGTALLQKAEEYAKSKEYSLIFLDTFSFQALSFYQKNGYQIFSEFALQGNVARYFLKKQLND